MTKLPRATLVLIATLSCISTWYVYGRVIAPNVDARMRFESDVLSNRIDPPYQYRVLMPLAANALQRLVSPVFPSATARHRVAYFLIAFGAFVGVFSLFYFFLRRFFTEKSSIIGLLLLQAVIPLSVTGYYMEDDFITILFFVLGLNLMFAGKDAFLPLVVGLGTLNREQTIFLVALYGIYLVSQRKVNRRTVAVAAVSVAVFLLVFFGIRFYFGFKPTQYTVALHIAHNTDRHDLLFNILPLWLAEVAGFVVLCVLAFGRSGLFWKLSFASLALYTVAFLLNGNLWELAKFLPAFLIMIPMGLQTLTGELVSSPAPETDRQALL